MAMAALPVVEGIRRPHIIDPNQDDVHLRQIGEIRYKNRHVLGILPIGIPILLIQFRQRDGERKSSRSRMKKFGQT